MARVRVPAYEEQGRPLALGGWTAESTGCFSPASHSFLLQPRRSVSLLAFFLRFSKLTALTGSVARLYTTVFQFEHSLPRQLEAGFESAPTLRNPGERGFRPTP